MKRHHHKQGYYEGDMNRRHQEMMDAGMIREDRSAVANMPQGVEMKSYPMERDYMPEMLDDSIRSVDEQINADNAGRKKDFKPKKV